MIIDNEPLRKVENFILFMGAAEVAHSAAHHLALELHDLFPALLVIFKLHQPISSFQYERLKLQNPLGILLLLCIELLILLDKVCVELRNIQLLDNVLRHRFPEALVLVLEQLYVAVALTY